MTLNPIARRCLARSLRARFSRTISPTILEKISDDKLLEQYEAEHARKEAAMHKRAISSELRLALSQQLIKST
ncbi:MAG TPA: hypothetical protein VK525_06740 [Candidatus Saccharimonadales bacterium]|nr:hypothetical protein [Candidatus Saccharimonadales bacterium]